jgi:hypothetical protein
MKRLSLQIAYTPTHPDGALAAAETSVAVSDAIFVPRDDAVVDQPSDNSLPATNYPADVNPANEPLSRAYAGEYSWLATITPNDAGTANSAPAPGQTYTLSLVVFNRRLMTVPTAGSGQEEMVRADATITGPATNYGGGEFRLSDASAAKLEVATPGQWMMLCRDESAVGAGYRVFKWYRIVTAAPVEALSSGSGFERYVTLAGPDWQVLDPSSSPAPQPTYACLIAGAIAVYERPVRLEEPSSVWNPR